MHYRFSSSRFFSIFINLAFLLSLAFVGSSEVQAQTRETLHSQNPNHEKDQVHVMPEKTVDNRPWSEIYASPKVLSSFGGVFDQTFWSVSIEGIICFLIIFAVLAWCILFRSYKSNRRAAFFDGTSKVAVWGSIGFGLLVFVVLDIPLILSSYKHTHHVMWNYPTGPDVVRVMVMPQQWVWNFKYPGNDGQFNTDDDIDTINELRVPVGKKVMLQIKSKDVIHGFMLPNLRYQIDAMPGHVTKFWFDTTYTGDFELACYHLCGTSHYKMKGFVKVLEESDFASWVRENSEWAKAKFDPEDKQVQWGWNWGADDKLQSQNPAPQMQLQPAQKQALHSTSPKN